jgi:hypothetical protein
MDRSRNRRRPAAAIGIGLGSASVLTVELAPERKSHNGGKPIMWWLLFLGTSLFAIGFAMMSYSLRGPE